MSFYTRRDALKLGAACALTPALGSLGYAQKAKKAASSKKEAAKDPYADGVLVTGEPPAPKKDSYTIAVLPDTQNYSEHFPQQFLAQTKWIAENRDKRNIACVFHLGDITNRSTPAEWEVANKAMNQLDGHVPYFMVCGNHDYSGGRCQDRTTLFNDYFPLSKYKDTPNFGGVYDQEPDRFENSYHTFNAGGRDHLVLCLEFGPRNDVVRWANEVAAKHADHTAFLLTHAYMYFDDTRYDWKNRGEDQRWNPHSYGVATNLGDDVNDGEELWQKLISKQPNFALTLNGHVLEDGLGRIVTPAADGREIPQVLVNFQMRPNGGDGWMRLIECRADGETALCYDYSPTLNMRNEADENQFRLKLPRLA